MNTHFSDDRDVLPSVPSARDPVLRRRGATTSGRLTILAISIAVVLISAAGGAYVEFVNGANYWSFARRQDFLLCRGLEIVIGVWLFTVGSSLASFLNVVAWRAPRGMSVNGHSFCPRCLVPIKSIDNVPIIGWLRLRGRCLVCQLPISAKYPIYEALGGSLFLLLYVVEFLSHGQNLPTVAPVRLEYGLPVNISSLPSWLQWSFAVHLLLVTHMLLIHMTRTGGAFLPRLFNIVPILAVVTIMFAFPISLSWSILSSARSLSPSRIEVISYLCQAIGSGIILATLTYRASGLEHVDEYSTQIVTGSHATRQSSRLFSWTAASVALTIATGVMGSIFCVSFSTVAAWLTRSSQSFRWWHAMRDEHSWLIFFCVLYLLVWRQLAAFPVVIGILLVIAIGLAKFSPERRRTSSGNTLEGTDRSKLEVSE